MTDEHFPLSPTAPLPPTEADYEAIADAVMATVRGRWFLAEFAKRNRNADTGLILDRIDRIETLLREPAPVSPAERMRIDLVEMAKAIARTRREIAAIRPDGHVKGTLSEASEELDSIVLTTERATSDILAATERIQEIAWTLRERGTDGAICDALDQRATEIYSACSFQDLTGQRTRKVVDVLQFLEDRIRAMIEIWGGTVPEEDGAPAPMTAPHVGEDRTVPHLEQQDIDRMMPAAYAVPPPAQDFGIAADVAASAPPGPAGGVAIATAAVATARPVEAAAVVETVMMPVAAVVGATALALDLTPMEVARQPEPVPVPEPEPEPAQQLEPAAEAVPQPEAVPQSAVQPEPIAPSEPEPAPEVEAVATPSEPRADPAAVLKRILAIIRAPNEPVRPVVVDAASAAPAAALPAEPVAQAAADAPGATAMSAGPAAPPEAGTSQSATIEAEPGVTVAAVVVAELSGPDAATSVVAAESAPSYGGSVAPQEPAREHAPQAALDEAADDILMPLPGPLTVDQAVDEMLKAPGRVDVAAAPVLAAAREPGLPPAAEPPAVAAEPAASETAPATIARSSPPFTIEVPAVTFPAASASRPELAAEAKPEQGQQEGVSAAAVETAAAPEAAAAPIAKQAAPEPPIEPIAQALAPLAESEPPAPAASEPPPPPANAVAPPPPPASRHPALAAIAALSDDDKIALFS